MKARPVRMGAMIATSLAAAAATVAAAQDLPSDAQVQAALGISYDRLGLVEYCAAKASPPRRTWRTPAGWSPQRRAV